MLLLRTFSSIRVAGLSPEHGVGPLLTEGLQRKKIVTLSGFVMLWGTIVSMNNLENEKL